ncbi:MAG: isoprenyl transferase [Syntrophus sp. (in: bacteria)]|nr:isoprenyl transferase [Syntrophus sp. (in: bacteria)]MBA4418414.1 isoprenyl transferase [Syntrophus sp. (in: bacteria)]
MHNLKTEGLPVHVAIIMDGNGRWAKLQGLPRAQGHAIGIDSVREIVTATRDLNIPYLTLYAFSKENWSRPKEEVKILLKLLGYYLEMELPLMMEKGIRFNLLGEISDFPKRLQTQLLDVMDRTGKNRDLLLNIALSYSGRREILHVVSAMIEDAKQGLIKKIDERTFSKYLYTKNMPDPDLLIRTSGEMRLSNFLLWQMAYTEIYVTHTLWPDFRKDQYMEALTEFSKRERRFGGIKEN